MKEQSITNLYHKFFEGNCSPAELQQLLDHFEQFGKETPLLPEIREQLEAPHIPTEDVRLRTEKIVAETDQLILQHTDFGVQKPLRKKISYRAIAIAACVLLICSLAYIFLPQRITVKPQILVSQFGGDAPPGNNRATLSLSNGKTYALSSKQAGIQMGKDIEYDDGSTLVQNASTETSMVTTPMGGQYTVTLSDGTKVWLNAGSSIAYPNTFAGKTNRTVQLTGEAYFSVSKNKRQPFIVESKGQRVRVLGTEFNINAYNNEPVITTTLVNGSISLSQPKSSANVNQLRPNQQAIYDGSNTTIHEVDAQLAAAWKDGEFRFKATPLSAVLRQLERWYDIKVDYTNVPHLKIHASIRREKNLSSVLYAISQSTDVKFEISERRLSIRK